MRKLVAAAALALCACGGPAPRDLADPGIEVRWSMIEIPRPGSAPSYRKQGVEVTALRGGSPWSDAGVQAGDVIASVNRAATLDPDAFADAVGWSVPKRVAIRRESVGVYGGRMLELELE